MKEKPSKPVEKNDVTQEEVDAVKKELKNHIKDAKELKRQYDKLRADGVIDRIDYFEDDTD